MNCILMYPIGITVKTTYVCIIAIRKTVRGNYYCTRRPSVAVTILNRKILQGDISLHAIGLL